MNTGNVAIMQPYVFPYIGYFHLIDASDLFIFYDDVNFTRKSWINRNRILLNGEEFLFTVPVLSGSQNRMINEIELINDGRWEKKFLNQLANGYKKAPFFSSTMNLIKKVLEGQHRTIAELSIASIAAVCNYLGTTFTYLKSSDCSSSTRGMEKSERLARISQDLGFRSYVNAYGGKHLYRKDFFQSRGVLLSFVKSSTIRYEQFRNDFVPDLSIIDVLMFNSKDQIIEFMTSYTLE